MKNLCFSSSRRGPIPGGDGKVNRYKRPCVLAGVFLLIWACDSHDIGNNVAYDAIFVKDRVVEWVVSVSDDDWHDLQLDQSSYVPANVEVEGVQYENVGLRLIGNKNRSKFSMRIRFNRFNPALRFHGVKRVNLLNNAGDPSLVREALALDRMRKAGVPAPRSSFVWVSMGDGGGVYTLTEQVDNKFLKDRFGESKGELYKLERGGNLVFRGNEPENYDWINTYELDTDSEVTQGAALIGLMGMLEHGSDEDIEQRLPEALDVDEFLLMLAVNSWLSNMDSYAGTGGNLYLYHDSTGRFRAIAWNLNRAFGNYHGRHCRTAEAEQYCRETGTEYCEETCPDNSPQCPEYCVEYYAELCVEHHGEFCQYISKDDAEREACAQDAPQYCEYTTDEMLALDPNTPTCSVDRPLVERLLDIPSFKERYHEHLQTLVEGVLQPQAVEKEMQAMRELISDRADRDVGRDCVNCAEDFDAAFTTDLLLDVEDRWEERVPGLMPFVESRDELIRNILEGFFE